jgi:hypothetical protein
MELSGVQSSCLLLIENNGLSIRTGHQFCSVGLRRSTGRASEISGCVVGNVRESEYLKVNSESWADESSRSGIRGDWTNMIPSVVGEVSPEARCFCGQI